MKDEPMTRTKFIAECLEMVSNLGDAYASKNQDYMKSVWVDSLSFDFYDNPHCHVHRTTNRLSMDSIEYGVMYNYIQRKRSNHMWEFTTKFKNQYGLMFKL